MFNTLHSTVRKLRKPLVIGIFLLILLSTNVYVLLNTPRFSEKYVTAFILGNALFILMALYIYWLCRRAIALSNLTESLARKKFHKSSVLLCLLLLILPFLFIIHVPDSAHNWDFFEIFINTSLLHGQNFTHLPATEDQLFYFLRYPNNQFFGMVYNWLFAPFHLTEKIWVETALSAVLTAVSVFSGSLIVKKMRGVKATYFYNLSAFAFVPFYVYGAQFYTDTASLPFVMLALLFIIYAIKSNRLLKQVLYFILGLLISFLGYNIKPTVLIPLIASLIFLLLTRAWRKLLIALLLSVVLYTGTHQLVKTTVASDPAFSVSANQRYNLPLIHWVTMSFDPRNVYGGFNPKVLAYSESFPDLTSKKQADQKLLFDNLKKMGPLGILQQLERKILYTWFNGDLSDFFYTYHHENPLIYRYFDWTSFNPNQGNITGWLLIKGGQTLYWIFLVPFMFYQVALALFKKKWTLESIPALSLAGLTLFLLIWEANSRYLYNFAPIMLLLASFGVSDFVLRLQTKHRNGNKNELSK